MYQVYCDSFLLYSSTIENLKLIRPKVQLEDNKTGTFTFTIYPDHPYFSMINKMTSIITVYQDDFLLFRGRVLNEEIGFHNEKQITCEGDLAFLLDSIQRPYNYSGSITGFLTQLINTHNSQVDAAKRFTLGNVTVTDPNNTIARSDINYTKTWDVIEKKLLEELGGHIIVRHSNGVHYLDYLADYTTISNQKIEFAKNLLDMKRTRKGESIITALIPLGANLTDADGNETDERLTIKSVNGGLDYIYDQAAVNQYGWIFGTNIWDDVTVASNLLTKGRAYLGSLSTIITKIDLSAADLAGTGQNVSSFHLGTYVRVTSNPHGIDQNFLVSKLTIDLMNPASNKLTLGGVVNSLTDGISKYTSITVKDGKDGKDGKGIKTTVVTYQAGTSGTTAPTGTWQNTVPSVAENQYLWTRVVITYSDNTTSISYSVGKMGASGADGSTIWTTTTAPASPNYTFTISSLSSAAGQTPKVGDMIIYSYYRYTITSVSSTTVLAGSRTSIRGATGATGKGISSIIEYYAVSTSNSTAPSTWQTTVPTMTSTNKYLWNYETVTYTDDTTTDTAKKVIGVYGATGATGKGISSITNYYLASNSLNGITRTTSGWTETVQSVSSSKKYLWNYETVTYTDSTTASTDPCIIGAYGDKGDTGNGISTIVEYYQVSTSNTTAPTTWVTTVPTMTTSKKYLWNYESVTYTDGTTVDTTKKVIGVYGTTGATGKGISSVVNHYLATNASSGVTTSTSGWTETVQDVTSSKKYLWNYETVTYTDSTTASTDPCIIGAYGDTGDTGNRGTGILEVTTEPVAYTTEVSGFTPSYRITRANVLAQSGATEIYVGDLIKWGSFLYPVGVPNPTWIYLGARTSIKGDAGKDAAIQSDTPPTDTSYLWLDTSVNPPLMKRYAPEYQLLVAEPSDWASNYTAYFTFNSSTGTYSAVTGSTAPEFALDTYFKYVSWVVVNDTTQAFYVMEKNVSSELSKTESNIMSRVSEEYYLKDETDSLVSAVSTTVTQNKEAVDILFETYKADLDDLASGTDAQFEEITKYIRFVDGKIILGEVGNELELHIANDRMSFLQNNAEVAYFSNNKLYVTDGEYTNSLRLGQFAFLPRENGNLSFKKLT